MLSPHWWMHHDVNKISVPTERASDGHIPPLPGGEWIDSSWKIHQIFMSKSCLPQDLLLHVHQFLLSSIRVIAGFDQQSSANDQSKTVRLYQIEQMFGPNDYPLQGQPSVASSSQPPRQQLHQPLHDPQQSQNMPVNTLNRQTATQEHQNLGPATIHDIYSETINSCLPKSSKNFDTSRDNYNLHNHTINAYHHCTN